MSGGLLLKDVVARAKIDRSTARYVLDNCGTALDVPRNPGQGQHRRLDVDEAVRLATCVRLVRLGVPLDQAEQTVAWCEAEWRKVGPRGEPDAEYAYHASVTNPWRIRLVIDGGYTYVQVRPDNGKKYQRDRLQPAFEPDEYCRVPDWHKVLIDDVSPDMIEAGWSLTHMAMKLAARP